MQRMNPPRGMGPMGPGPQVSLAPKSIFSPLCPVSPLVLMRSTLVLHLENPSF